MNKKVKDVLLSVYYLAIASAIGCGIWLYVSFIIACLERW